MCEVGLLLALLCVDFTVGICVKHLETYVNLTRLLPYGWEEWGMVCMACVCMVSLPSLDTLRTDKNRILYYIWLLWNEAGLVLQQGLAVASLYHNT